MKLVQRSLAFTKHQNMDLSYMREQVGKMMEHWLPMGVVFLAWLAPAKRLEVRELRPMRV
jgi:hypothetical protein